MKTGVEIICLVFLTEENGGVVEIRGPVSHPAAVRRRVTVVLRRIAAVRLNAARRRVTAVRLTAAPRRIAALLLTAV